MADDPPDRRKPPPKYIRTAEAAADMIRGEREERESAVEEGPDAEAERFFRGLPRDQALAKLRTYYEKLHPPESPEPPKVDPPGPPTPAEKDKPWWSGAAFWSAVAAIASLLTALLALIFGVVKHGDEGSGGHSSSDVTGTITSTVIGTVTVSVVGTPSVTVTITVPPTLTPGQKN